MKNLKEQFAPVYEQNQIIISTNGETLPERCWTPGSPACRAERPTALSGLRACEGSGASRLLGRGWRPLSDQHTDSRPDYTSLQLELVGWRAGPPLTAEDVLLKLTALNAAPAAGEPLSNGSLAAAPDGSVFQIRQGRRCRIVSPAVLQALAA